MAERKTYATRLNDFEAETVEVKAAEVWPEHADNISELMRAIITDWRHTRDQGGKSNKILKAVQALDSKLELILAKLEENNHVPRQPEHQE